MATVEHTASDTYGKIPLGRRIAEVLQEKGDAFSVRAFAERIGENRETFRKTLLGNRPISISLIEKVSKALRVSEERLRQLDTHKKEEELEKLLRSNSRTKDMMLRALSISNELLALALGITERCTSYMNLGRVQYHLQQYDEAHDSWVRAMEFAEMANKEFGDSTLLYQVTSLLMLSYTIRKEYTNIQHTLNIVEDVFSNDPKKMGYVYYTRMKWYDHRGDLEKAKEYSYVALDFFKKTNEKEQIGKALINVANYEFYTGNYVESRKILAEAIQVLETFEYARSFAVNDFVKCLLKLGEHEHAAQMISDNSTIAQGYPNLYGKLQIMYSMAKDDPSYAISVAENSKYSTSIRYYAYKFLMEYSVSKRDSESLMLYYEKSSILLNKNNGLLTEEGF